MEKGQVKMEELVKVIDHMKTLSREDLIKKMLESPAKKMEKMKTAWSRFLTEINSSFMIDVFTSAFDSLAESIGDLTKFMKENKDTVDGMISRIKVLGKALWELKWILLGLYAANKLIGRLGIASGLWSFLTRAPVLPPAPMSVRIANFFKAAWRGALTLARRSLPVMGLLFIHELVETLMGKEGWLSAIAANENPLIAWLAKFPLLVGETIKNLALGTAVGVGWLYNLLFGDEQEFRMAEDMLGMWFADLNKTMEKYRILPDSWSTVLLDSLDPVIERLKVVYQLMKAVAVFDPLSPIESWKDSSAAFDEAMRLSKGIADRSKVSEAASLIKSPSLVSQVRTTPTYAPSMPFMIRGAVNPQQGATMSSPTFNLTINAQGTPEDIKRIASETFMDQLQSTMYGTIANFQSGQ